MRWTARTRKAEWDAPARYGVAILLTVLAALAVAWVRAFARPTIVVLLLYAAATASAWYGGLGPGILATILASLAADFLLVPPVGTLGIAYDPGTSYTRLLLFVVVTLAATVLSASLREARRRVEAEDTDRQFLFDLGASLQTTTKAEALIEIATRAIGKRFDADRCTWVEVDPFENRSIVHREYRRGAPPIEGSYPLDMWGDPIVAEARMGLTVTVDDAATDPRTAARYANVFAPLGFRAFIVVPLIRSGTWVALLGVVSMRPRRWTDREVAHLRAIAERVWPAFEYARTLAEVSAAREDAEVANRAKTEFLATMSHELRTPLHAIAGYIELLELEIHGPLNDAQRADLARIRRSQQHLLRLITDVLNFAKIETGRLDLTLEDVQVDRTLAPLAELIAPQVAAKRLVYEYHRCDPTLLVRADPERLQQILLNLLSNAVKFTAPGGRITLSCGVRGGDVAIRVHDTGRGIPSDRLTAVFEPFVQVERSLTQITEGIGLGLAISRDLAWAMDGDITVESTLGQGSTFILYLPRGGPEAAQEEAVSAERA